MKRMKKGLSMVLVLSMLVMLFVPMMVTAEDNGDIIRLTDRINLGTTGNIESIEKEELTLYIPMENTFSEEVVVEWTFEIYDENERFVDDFYYSATLSAGEERTDSVNFKTPELCGVYTVKASYKATHGTEVDYGSYDRENFSVSYINEVGEGNKNLGINVHTIGRGQGETEDIANAVVAAGYGWIREANGQNLSNPNADLSGEWTMDEAQVADLEYYKDMGIDILMQIWGPQWLWADHRHRGSIPQTDEERVIFKAWMEELVEKTSSHVDAYEVFNECESAMFPSNYEGSVEDRAAVYLESLKVVNEVVKGADTIIPVVASASAGIFHTEFNRQLWALGGSDYVDIFSTHRYPYHGSEYMRYVLVDLGAEKERELLGENSSKFDGKMWLTEIGYATPDIYADGEYTGQSGEKGYTWWNNAWDRLGYEDGVPRREQARGLTNAYFVNTVTPQAFDKLFVLNIVDQDDPTYYQSSWGILNSYFEGINGYTPLSAKPAFVATAAFNHFIDDTSVVKQVAKSTLDRPEEYWHAAWFDNSNNTKFTEDVIVVQADIPASDTMETDVYVKLSTGASEVDVYDMYGNFLGTMKDSNGQYWMPLTHEAYYLVGEFTKVEGSKSNFITKSPITITNRYRKNVVPGSTSTFKVNGMSSGDTIEVRGLDVESISNGTVTVKVPELFSGKAYGQVLVKDSSGNLKFATVVELWLTAIGANGIQVKTYDDALEIKGFTGTGTTVGEVTVAVTDEDGEYLALDQFSTADSGIFNLNLNVPQVENRVTNLKLFNTTTTLNQQLIPGFEAYYTCVDGEGNPISFADLTVDKLDEGETITIKLNLGESVNDNVMLMGGIYSNSGALVQADASNADTDGNELSIELTANNKENIKSIKIFVWDNDLKPLKNTTKVN